MNENSRISRGSLYEALVVEDVVYEPSIEASKYATGKLWRLSLGGGMSIINRSNTADGLVGAGRGTSLGTFAINQ